MNEPSINHFDSLKKLLEDENQDVKTQKSSAKKLGSDTILMILNDFLETFKVRFRGAEQHSIPHERTNKLLPYSEMVL